MAAGTNDLPRLCTGCQGFDIRSLLIASKAKSPPLEGHLIQPQHVHRAIPRYFSHHGNLTHLQLFSDRCDLCSAIWQQYVQVASPYDLTPEGLSAGLGSQPIFFGTTQWDEHLHGSPTVSVMQFGPRGESRTLAWFEVFANRDSIPSDNANHLIGRSTTDSSDSAACFKIALEMLENCLTTHAKCNKRNECAPIIPTRLLQVDADHSVARLVDTNGSPKQFVALSYCWGGDDNFILTSASEQSLRDGMPFVSFPATLRDALVVTRSLNMQYIWIDAICIYQDSLVDWKRESVRMRDVYRGAVVTIDAAAASKASEGMFCKRPAKGVRCTLDWRNNLQKQSHVYLRPATEYADTTLRDSPTSKRAWTLQENLLAPRTLHYGSQQVAFDCAEGWYDEAGRHTKPTELYNSKSALHDILHETRFRTQLMKLARSVGLPTAVRIKHWSIRESWRNLHAFDEDFFSTRFLAIVFQGYLVTPAGDTMTYYDQWRYIVARFTSRSMSNETDVFPALDGLAQAFHDSLGEDSYIAGMWKGDLIRSLNWRRHALPGNHSWQFEACGPKQYLAPSWSWASIHGRSATFIGCDSNQVQSPLTSRIRIIDVKTETEEGRPFVRILRGHLVLEGQLLEVDGPLSEMCPDRKSLAESADRFPWSEIEWHEFVQQHHPHEGQKFVVLHLSSDRDLHDMIRAESYLVLETASENTYRRVGHFNVRRTGNSRKRFLRKRGMQMEYQNNEEIRRELKNAVWQKRRIRIV